MLRTVWLGLGCLICIGGLFALKISFGMPVKLEDAAHGPTVVRNVRLVPSPKSDGLNAAHVDDAPDKILVKPLAIVLPKVDASSSEKVTLTGKATTLTVKINKSISRHGDEGYTRLSSRSVHKPWVAWRTKHRS
jgi:hypothetical protein